MALAITFDRVTATSLAHQIYVALRRSIFEGKLKPGDTLREQHLATQFGVSQNTVREALFQLQHVGLVQRVPNCGTCVTQLSHAEIRERMEVRIPLERTAAVAAGNFISDQHLAELRKHLAAIIAAARLKDYFGVVAADLELHRYIWKMSANATLYRLLDQVTAPLFAFLHLVHHNQTVGLKHLGTSHELLITALESKDPQTIEAAITEHIESSYQRILRWMADLKK